MKRRILSLVLVSLLVFGCFAMSSYAGNSETPKLKFGADGKFTVSQIADLQELYVSSPFGLDFIRDIAKTEQPDLFVLSGDNIADGNANWGTHEVSKFWVKQSIDAFMNAFDKIYDEYGIPVTMVFGNHDAEGSGVTRAEQFDMYLAHRSFIGVKTDADKGTTGEHGPHFGTHNLPIYDAAGKTALANIWLFDTGDYVTTGGYDGVQKPQIDWFKKQHKALGKLPSIAFQHIMVPDVYDYMTPAPRAEEGVFGWTLNKNNDPNQAYEKFISRTLPKGTKGEMRETPGSGRNNYGEYKALCDAGVLALFVGHDHVNSYELKLSGTDLVNSPSTSFGSYGDYDTRGTRLITLDKKDLTKYSTKVITIEKYYAGDTLNTARLKMYSDMRTAGLIFDYPVFIPLLWVVGLFK